MLRTLPLAFALLLPLLASGCNVACDRAGCDAVQHPIEGAKISSGIAGYASSESDVVANGCAECPLSQATLHVWTSPTPIGSMEEAKALVDSQAATHTITVDERYEQALAPGNHLVCHDGLIGTVCAALEIASGEVYTVNVDAGYGGANLLVFKPGADYPATGGIFTLK